jgi:hypothetical protein
VVTYFEESFAWVSDEMSRRGESYTNRQRNRDLSSKRDMAWLERMVEEEKDEGKKKEDLHLRSHGGEVDKFIKRWSKGDLWVSRQLPSLTPMT